MNSAACTRAPRWLRLVAIAIGALVLASCRALPTTQSRAVDAVPMTQPHAVDTARVPPPAVVVTVAYDAAEAAAADGPPDPGSEDNAAGMKPSSRSAVSLARLPVPTRHRAGSWTGDACGSGACDVAAGACGPAGCPALPGAAAACGPSCPPLAVRPCPPPPVVGPWYVCDGGDHEALAMPVGEHGLANLTEGDTVARYRPADDGPANDCVKLATTNCACVYAPRFAAVREVIRPAEDAADQGPNGLSLDRLVSQQVDLLPVQHKTQPLAPAGARVALPGVALEERLGPLAVDQTDQPQEDDARVRPAEDVAELQPEGMRLAQTPRLKIGFEVPVAWTCIKAANVLVGDQEAQVVAADRGTATLRFECPGRAELTLCKRAGTDTARPGEELDFMIYFLNSGDRPLTDIVLADAIPTRLELVPGSAVCNLPATVGEERGDDGSVVVTWKLTDTLQPGDSGFVRFRALVK